MINSREYPDLEPLEGSGVKRLQNAQKVPKIDMGRLFWSDAPHPKTGKIITDKQRIAYFKEMAESYHHACQLIQKERDNLIAIANHQEDQLISDKTSFANHQELMSKLITDNNAEKQLLLIRLNEKDAEIARLKNGDDN